MVRVIYPGDRDPENNGYISVFLAGTIDNGDSIDWQKDIIKYISEEFPKGNIVVYNPRRKEFNKNESSNKLEEQINWELDHLNKANIIFMNILGNSKSPISLLELGLFHDHKLILACPKEFYRYTNIKVTCENFGIDMTEYISEATITLARTIKSMSK